MENPYNINTQSSSSTKTTKDEYVNFNMYQKIEGTEKGVWLFRVSTIPAQKDQTISILDMNVKMFEKINMNVYYVEGNEKKEAETKSAIDFSALFN